jgi:hypothetical protein
VSCPSAPASASQADLLRDLQIIQAAAISPTTNRISRAQPRAPSPWDSAEAGVPAADVAGEVVGGFVGEVVGSTEVEVRISARGITRSR